MLKPWARAVVTLWVLVVVPMLAFSLFTMVRHAPAHRSAPPGRAPASSRRCSAGPGATPTSSRSPPAAIAIVAVRFPILAIAVILIRLLRQRRRLGAWRRTAGQAGPPRPRRPGRRRPGRRAGLGLVAARRHLPADPALRGRHPARRRASALRTRAPRADRLVAGQRGHDRHRLGRRRRPPDRREAPARAGPGPARLGRAASARLRRHRRLRRDRAAAVLGVPVQQAAGARRGRQPGDGGQHHRQHDPVRRGVRAGLGRRRLPRAEHQRGLRLRQLHELRRRLGRASRSCWSPATTTSRCRRTSRPRSTTTASTA